MTALRTPAGNPVRLPALLHQVAADLADLAVTCLLGGHYYNRTNHPRYRHFSAVFALRRHALEQRDMGYDKFVQSLASAEDWAYEQQLRKANQE